MSLFICSKVAPCTHTHSRHILMKIPKFGKPRKETIFTTKRTLDYPPSYSQFVLSRVANTQCLHPMLFHVHTNANHSLCVTSSTTLTTQIKLCELRQMIQRLTQCLCSLISNVVVCTHSTHRTYHLCVKVVYINAHTHNSSSSV